ncbi:MAG: hypothetical protein LBH26_05745, partial [Treponema sp.]|nr:hypothetical protein [Treponema sp.]
FLGFKRFLNRVREVHGGNGIRNYLRIPGFSGYVSDFILRRVHRRFHQVYQACSAQTIDLFKNPAGSLPACG